MHRKARLDRARAVVALAVARERHELDGVVLVALTGYGQSDDRARAIDAGFAVHLVKPVSVSALGRVFEQIATGYSM